MKTQAPPALALRLIRAFLKVKDPKKRRDIIDLVEAKLLPTNEVPTER